jgi:hypothetical protein
MEADTSSPGSGAVYVFVRASGGVTWAQQAYVKSSNNLPVGFGNASFGHSVAIDGDTIVVGARSEQSAGTGVNGNMGADESAPEAGAAYVFTRAGVTWTQQAYLKASNTDAYDKFGWSVDISGDTIVVGAKSENSDGSSQSNNGGMGAPGAAYVFTRASGGTEWTQQAYLKASNPSANDLFGNAVAIDGDTIAIGAPYEGSDSTGVNNGQNGNAAGYNSGAAYVFTRASGGTVWSQQAFIKASNTGVNHVFGHSVALLGDAIAVGAYNGNTAATNSGAAFVFTRSGGVTWAQQALLTAPHPDISDHFGFSIAISADSIVVGAHFEDSNAMGINGNQTNEAATNAGAAFVWSLLPPLECASTFAGCVNTNEYVLVGAPCATSTCTVAECCKTYVGARMQLRGTTPSIRGDVTFLDGMRMVSTSDADATCTAAERGKIYYIGAAAGDSFMMCMWTGAQYELKALSV